jgi:uncharacterized protein (TIGR03435 family)
MVRLLALPVALILCATAYGQGNEKPAVFEVADVHVSSQHSIPDVTGGVLRNGRYTLQNATMLDLIRTAYNTEDDRIVGGPTWLESDHFDVIAKAPNGTPRDKVAEMLRALLAERFGLTVHNGTQSMQAYVLTVGKVGPKMDHSAETETGRCQGQQQPPATSGGPLYAIVSCHGLTAADIARDFHQMAAGYVGDHPMVDSTQLDGRWDFDIKFSPRNQLATAGSDAITFFDALDKQLGLKLELRTAPVPVLIVDKVNEKPTENAPGVADLLPTVPTEFEVADIKPSAPQVTAASGGIQAGGRIDLRGFTLKTLMSIAWGLQENIAGDFFTGAPSWFDSARFDVVARAPGSGPVKANELPVDEEALLTMLRNLLTDRFKLKTHPENREVTVYTMMAPKGDPKIKKAEPTERAGCKRGPGPPNGNGTSTIMETCLNTTMTDLAKYLPQWAPAYFDHPVFDATGLTGGWNFSLVWTGRGQLLGDLAPKNAAAGVSAADPGGASAFEAVEKQLGFKLQSQKRPMPVIVIDHVEKP